MTLGIDPHSAKPYGYATLAEVHALMVAYDLDLVAQGDKR